MSIRRAGAKDVDDILKLLVQVNMVHHIGRPDLFHGPTTKYSREELLELFQDDARPVFVLTDENDLIGVFDLDNLTSSAEGADFLRSCEKREIAENIGDAFDLPKSVILTESEGREKVYLSPITALTLWKRSRDPGLDLY